METILQDLRIAARRLRRTPAFTVIAVATLALGIGANSAIFSLVDAVLLRPLPFKDQDGLVRIFETRNGQGEDNISGHEFMAWREAHSVLDGVLFYRGADLTLTGRGDATAVNGIQVSASFFDVLGTKPLVGRGFREGEDAAGANRVVVLSHKMWVQRFSADSGVVGYDIVLNNEKFQVLGVMSPGGEFDPDLWVPANIRVEAQAVGRHALAVIGRLLPGVTMARAESELNGISARLERELPQFNTGHRAHLVPVYEDVVGDSRRAVLVVFGAVGFVLLIACANVAHLLLTRAAGRRREVAICAAVGASRARLISQLLSESVLLSLAGGLLGLLLAVWIVALLPGIHAVHIPRLAEVRVDRTAIAVTFVLALMTGVISGLIPALRVSRVSLTEWLADGSRTSAGAGRRFADALIVSEIALAMVLLVGAGLMLKSFSRLTGVQPGFDAHNVLAVATRLPAAKYPTPSSQRDAFDELTRRIAALPGVVAVGATTDVPIATCCSGIQIAIDGAPTPPPGQEPSALYASVSDDYFAAMNIPVKSGRVFNPSDARIALPLIRWWEQAPYPAHFAEPQAGPAAVINESMARQYFPNGDAVGRRIRIVSSPWITVVGVVGDVHHRGLATPAVPEIFLSQSQEPHGGLTFTIRTAGDPRAVATAVRSEIRGFDRELPINALTSMDDVLHDAVGGPRFNAFALGAFALVALTIALVGLYGVISHSVAQRTREIGIRGALGASARDVMRLVLGRAGQLTAIGIGVGVVVAYAMSTFLTKLLFDVEPTDPGTFAAIAALLAVAALAASYAPARRALRIDPLVALRND
jgi:putative ABC transport system permease protein